MIGPTLRILFKPFVQRNILILFGDAGRLEKASLNGAGIKRYVS